MENFVLASRLIKDLIESELLDLFLQFPAAFYTTDLAVCALKERKYKNIVNAYFEQGHIKVKKYSDDELLQLLTFRENIGYGERLSLADCSVILLAKELNCPLVSSDAILCSMAEPFVETRLSKYDWSAKTGYIYELIPLKI
ncbi:MAG: hypothetical protein LUD72_09300 [Bacteroidales bacterium]|nr:hypothetical protein [Bacteroidales bacterium]